MTAGFYAEEIALPDVQGMVSGVLTKAGGTPIRCLSVYDHGTYDHDTVCLNFGTDLLIYSGDGIGLNNFDEFEPLFVSLRGRFAENGYLHLCHCYAGRKLGLLWRFAKVLGVPVVGGLGLTNGVLRVNFGGNVMCTPRGYVAAL